MKYNFDPKKINLEDFVGMTAKELTDQGIVCPTCLDRFTNHGLYGDDSERKTFEDKDIECAFVPNPRAPGHMMISTQDHYHDMSETPTKLNSKVMKFATEYMKIIKKVYGCERVYLCTMSDGPINHYHIQLIPRYKEEERGSENFVKPRHDYVFEPEKFKQVCEMIQAFAAKQSPSEQSSNEPQPN